MILAEPAMALTDLALGAVAVALAFRLRGRPGVSRHWVRTFEWTGVAALAGAAHHGLLPTDSSWRDPSWAAISGMVVVAISYMLAATVADVLGPGRARAFWLLRSASLVAYAAVALLGHAGVGAILLCEGVTMLAVLALWGVAARRGHPRAPRVIAAIVASGGAAALQATPSGIGPIDPTSMYHLAQTVGVVLLYRAAALAPAPARPPVGAPAGRDGGRSTVERAR
jgi:hypothetical protein